MQEKVNELVACCDKKGEIYARSPRKVAQVSRTGKWLLNALTAPGEELKEQAEAQT